MNEDHHIKEIVEKMAKVIFGSFGVFIGAAIIGEVVFLFIMNENYIDFLLSPLFAIPVMIISAPILWKYMK